MSEHVLEHPHPKPADHPLRRQPVAPLWARTEALLDADEDTPLSRHVLLGTIFAFFLIFIIWGNLATLDEVAHGMGKIIPSGELQRLQSLDAGIVEEILVQEGEQVKQGQILMRLSDIEASSDLRANRVRYYGLLAAITRLQAQANGEEEVHFSDDIRDNAPESVREESDAFTATQKQLDEQNTILNQQLAQRLQEVEEINTRIKDLRGIIAMQTQEKDIIQKLVERGSAPKLELLQLQRGIKEKTAELNSQRASLPRVQSTIEEAQAKLDETLADAKARAQSDLAAKRTELNEIAERLSALEERKTRREIKSPVDGVIQDITVNTIGGVVRAGDDLIKIVPQNDQLIVETRVKPSDRAFIYPGQDATVKITAYDFSIYGGLKAKLIDISADSITDEHGETYYRVRLKTDETALHHNGEILPIVPGMIASADILTGKKTVMHFLMKPITKTLDNALHER